MAVFYAMEHNKILGYDAYVQMERSGFAVPYIVQIVRGNQELLLYGAVHSNDCSHSQFYDIETRWKEFIHSSEAPIALVEGHFDQCPPEDTADGANAIKKGGEALYLVHLARQYGVGVVSPEPDRAWEANELAAEFGRDTTLYYYFIRRLRWLNKFTAADMQLAAEDVLTEVKADRGWDEVDFSLERMRAVHAGLFNTALQLGDLRWVDDLVTPVHKNTVINLVGRRCGMLRDIYILEQIQRYWHQGKSLFTVLGFAHAIKLEPSLRSLENIS